MIGSGLKFEKAAFGRPFLWDGGVLARVAGQVSVEQADMG
jgi:hypothetical protein